MSDLPPDGNEPRNSKRPANVVRDSADRLDEAPPSKRSKAASTLPSEAEARAASQPHVFHSRIFISIVPEAFRAGRFTVLDKSAIPALGAQNLICVSVDMNAQPTIVTIKKKVQHEHGTDAEKQTLSRLRNQKLTIYALHYR